MKYNKDKIIDLYQFCRKAFEEKLVRNFLFELSHAFYKVKIAPATNNINYHCSTFSKNQNLPVTKLDGEGLEVLEMIPAH